MKHNENHYKQKNNEKHNKHKTPWKYNHKSNDNHFETILNNKALNK